MISAATAMPDVRSHILPPMFMVVRAMKICTWPNYHTKSCRSRCKNMKVLRVRESVALRFDLVAHPGLEPLVVALVGELGGQDGGVFGRQQGVGPRPLLCPPGFELVGLVRIAVRVANAGRRDHVAHDRPGPVLSQPHRAQVLLE